MDWLQSGTVKSLLQICVESAQQILRILSNLLEQGLLEIFLPFDMDAAFTSTISLLMAAAIDISVLQDHSPWSQRAYVIFDDMAVHGNLSARLVKSELKQLDDELAQLLMKGNAAMSLSTSTLCRPEHGSDFVDVINPVASGVYNYSLEPSITESLGQHYELSPDQLMDLANSLDLNSLAWPLPSMDDFPGQDL
ncbi:hypothetical protein Plec18170_008890 [Paecilomyces lecythidis]